MSGPLAPKRDNKKQTASCMCWFPAAGSDRRRQTQRHAQRLTTPHDTEADRVIATLGYKGDGAAFGSVWRSLGSPLPVLPPVRGSLHDSHPSEASARLGLDATPIFASDADTGLAPAHQIRRSAAPRADAGEVAVRGHLPGHGSSLADLTLADTSLEEFSVARQDDMEDHDVMDIPIEIPSPTTCTRVLVPSNSFFILQPSPKPSPSAANETAIGKAAPVKGQDGPPVPPRFKTVVAQIAQRERERERERAASGVRLPMHAKLVPGGRSQSLHNGWESVKDSDDEGDPWVRSAFKDPTVVLTAHRDDMQSAPLGPTVEESHWMPEVQVASSRNELEESHGFFTSSSHPFSSSPVPLDRQNAKTSGSIMSAASTNAKTSGSITSAASTNQFTLNSDSQSAANQHGRGGSPPPIREHWAPDGALIRDRVNTEAPEHKSHKLRPHSVGGRTPSLPGRPPSPCLRPGTLKNLTSAFENHIRRVQVRKSTCCLVMNPCKNTRTYMHTHPCLCPPLHSAQRFQELPLYPARRFQDSAFSSPQINSHRVVSPRFTSSETLRRRIELDLQMLSMSDDDSSGASTPRDARMPSNPSNQSDLSSPNNGLLC
jgi:hypothetical protein